METAGDIPLSPGQEAALARLVYTLRGPRAVAILAGAAGVGKSLVLARLAGRLVAEDIPCLGPAPAADLADRCRDAPSGAVVLADDAQDALRYICYYLDRPKPKIAFRVV